MFCPDGQLGMGMVRSSYEDNRIQIKNMAGMDVVMCFLVVMTAELPLTLDAIGDTHSLFLKVQSTRGNRHGNRLEWHTLTSVIVKGTERCT